MQLFKPKTNAVTTFNLSVAELARLKQQVISTACPNCKQTTLSLKKYTQGQTGWESEMECSNCGLNGVVNSTGFEFKGMRKGPKL